eukprot:6170209-Pleurochrysis_carterae.AAC.1
MQEGRRETQAESSTSLCRSKRKVGQEGRGKSDKKGVAKTRRRACALSHHTPVFSPRTLPPSRSPSNPEPLSLTPLPASSPSK